MTQTHAVTCLQLHLLMLQSHRFHSSSHNPTTLATSWGSCMKSPQTVQILHRDLVKPPFSET